jgi:Xaa-Pro dipeptidase
MISPAMRAAERRARIIKAGKGELYILDLGPVYRGYFSDNARTFAVDRKPTDKQMKAWEAIVAALAIVEKMARPGRGARKFLRRWMSILSKTRKTGMPHHLGHGVGLAAA